MALTLLVVGHGVCGAKPLPQIYFAREHLARWVQAKENMSGNSLCLQGIMRGNDLFSAASTIRPKPAGGI